MHSTFTDYLYAQGLAESTVREYDKWARRCARWCWTHRLDIDTITAQQIREWASTCPPSRASQKSARTALKHYYTWIGRDGELWKTIALPPNPKMRSRALTPQDARTLRDACLMIGGNRAALATLCGLYLAARASEIAGLTWQGWQGNRFEFYRPKNRDRHTVPVHPVLQRQLETAREHGWSDYLFPGHGRPHVSATTVWEWVRQIGATAGVTVTPHQLRATAITTSLEATKDIHAVQNLAGHRSPEVTVGYARLSDARLEAAVDALEY